MKRKYSRKLIDNCQGSRYNKYIKDKNIQNSEKRKGKNMEIKNLEKIDEIKKKELRDLKTLLLLCLSLTIIICFIVSKIQTDSFKTTVFLMIACSFLTIMLYGYCLFI